MFFLSNPQLILRRDRETESGRKIEIKRHQKASKIEREREREKKKKTDRYLHIDYWDRNKNKE